MPISGVCIVPCQQRSRITVPFRPKGVEEDLLANETAIVKGEITVDEIPCRFQGDSRGTQKNYIKREVEY